MLRGYRGIVAALVIGLAFIALSTAAYQILEQTEQQPYPEYKYQPARDDLAPPPRKQASVTAYPYQPYCDEPKERDDADLCAQWAAVQAVGESNRLTRIGLRVTALEFGALVLSLVFTGWAAFAASKAARIAEEASKDAGEAIDVAKTNAKAAMRAALSSQEGNAIAREQMQRQLRPSVYLLTQTMTVDIPWDHVEDIAKGSITIKNYGQSPAKGVTVNAALHVGNYWSDRPMADIAETVIVFLGDIPAGADRTTGGYSAAGVTAAYPFILEETQSIFLEGQIQYKDAFGNEYYTNFQRAWTGPMFRHLEPAITPHWNQAT